MTILARRRAGWFAGYCLVLSELAAPARGQFGRLPVRVIEISAGQAYLGSGRSRGVHVGTPVRFGRFERRVTAATRSYCVVPASRLRVGARGTARVDLDAPAHSRFSAPRPLSAFFGQWPAAVFPARRQSPKRIPFTHMQPTSSRVDASLSSAATVLAQVGGQPTLVGRGELRAQWRVKAATRIPLELGGDLALQKWLGRYGTGVARGDRRPLLSARELAVRIGAADDYRAQIGRLRYAATNLGPIDGLRIEAARHGPVAVSGFGGWLPEPISGRPDPATGRFGLALDLEGERGGYAPELSLVLHGSVFRGRLDERRLYAQGQLWPGPHHIEAYAQASVFDEHNPWGRPRLDLSAAGAETDLRFGSLHLAARVDLRRPERSHWLDSTLPPTWLCSSASTPGSTAACMGSDDTRYLAQAVVGWNGSLLATQADAVWIGSSEPSLGHNAMLHAMLRTARPLGRFDFALGGWFERGSVLRTSLGLRADVGVSLARERVRLELYYRPNYRLQRAGVAASWDQGGGIGLHIAPSPALSVELQGDTRLGDLDAVLAMFLLRYRFMR